MSKLGDILNSIDPGAHGFNGMTISRSDASSLVKALLHELIGDVEQRETEDLSLNSWTHEDYKAFGKNELKIELHKKVEAL